MASASLRPSLRSEDQTCGITQQYKLPRTYSSGAASSTIFKIHARCLKHRSNILHIHSPQRPPMCLRQGHLWTFRRLAPWKKNAKMRGISYSIFVMPIFHFTRIFYFVTKLNLLFFFTCYSSFIYSLTVKKRNLEEARLWRPTREPLEAWGDFYKLKSFSYVYENSLILH